MSPDLISASQSLQSAALRLGAAKNLAERLEATALLMNAAVAYSAAVEAWWHPSAKAKAAAKHDALGAGEVSL